jgi:hypothetical protein
LAGGLIWKLLLTVLVIIIVWRGFRIWGDMQQRLTRAEAEQKRQRRAPAPMDLVPCPRCGTYIARGTACPSETCRPRPV